MTDLEDVSYYLGMEVCRDGEKNTLMLLQTAYLKVILEWFDMAKYSLSTIPIDNGLPNTIMPNFPDYQAPYEIVF